MPTDFRSARAEFINLNTSEQYARESFLRIGQEGEFQDESCWSLLLAVRTTRIRPCILARRRRLPDSSQWRKQRKQAWKVMTSPSPQCGPRACSQSQKRPWKRARVGSEGQTNSQLLLGVHKHPFRYIECEPELNGPVFLNEGAGLV